ncbi:MAG: cytochrome c maturation protein CcmE [Selenomonadaceae bacterium]|nr:cytochrome c maturation protein CcmE [Selenomonadaceae bacterium]
MRLVRKIFLIVLLLGFVAYAGFNLAESVAPYVTIAEARASTNSVQVKGLLDKNFVPQQTCDEFTFSLQDEATGETLRVKFDGVKPDQFDEAYHIVAIGKYDASDESFHAKKLLIKCPSKYERQQPQ